MSARPPQNNFFARFLRIRTVMTTEATRAIAEKNSVCQPAAEARKLNAAPLLNTSTRLKNGAMARLSPGARETSTAALET